MDEHEQRLSERIGLFNLTLKRVEADGHCQFRSLTDRLYQDDARFGKIRQGIVPALEKYRAMSLWFEWSLINSQSRDSKYPQLFVVAHDPRVHTPLSVRISRDSQ